MEYAKHELALNKTSHGSTLREHLEQVQKQTGITPKELNGPKFPTPLSYTWSAFLDLSNTRGTGMNGPLPISFLEIKAFTEVTGKVLTPKDVDIIKRLDVVYLTRE